MSSEGLITINEVEIHEVNADPTTGGGVAAPIGSLALLDTSKVWQKTGAGNTAWSRLSATVRAGTVAGASFSGAIKKFALTFTTAMSDTNYNITITGEDVRGWSTESKTTTGFTINSNAGEALTGNVSWQVVANMETV